MYSIMGKVCQITVLIIGAILLQHMEAFGLPEDASGKPLAAPFNYNAKLTSNVDEILPGGSSGYNLDGTGVMIGMWDGGSVRDTHEQIRGRAQNMTSATIHPHSCHVAGTMIGCGTPYYVEAGGMAPKAKLQAWPYIYNYMDEVNANTKILDVANFSLSTSISASEDRLNPSGLGDYTSHSRQWDEIIYNSNIILVKSAGNARNNLDVSRPLSTNPLYQSTPILREYYTLSPGSAAKNNIVVGAIRDLVDKPHIATDSSMTDFSSWGPTADGRIKPDVVANGERLLSMGYESDSHYFQQSGTSMSGPVVSGIVALLIQKFRQDYNGVNPPAALMRGLLIHTAIDAGPVGPDYRFGWGLVNARAAADAIENSKSKTSKNWFLMNDAENGEIIYKTSSTGNEPIRITLSWTDYPGDPKAELALVNDLDLLVEGPGKVYYPWTLDPSDPVKLAVQNKENHLDNVEQVYIQKPSAGEYSIHIKGNIKKSLKQEFCLWANGAEKPKGINGAFIKSTIPMDGVLYPEQLTIAFSVNSLTPIARVRTIWDKKNILADDQPAVQMNSYNFEFDVSKEKKGIHTLDLEITDNENYKIIKSFSLYKISMEYEDVMDTGDPVVGFLDELNNDAYYVLRPRTTGWYSVETTPVEAKGSLDTILTWQDDKSVSDDDNGVDFYSKLVLSMEKGKEYRFRVSGYNGANGFFAISARPVSSPPEKVINPLTGPNVEIKGDIKDVGEERYYSFKTSKFGYYVIRPSSTNSSTTYFAITMQSGDIIADTRSEQKIILQPDVEYSIRIYGIKGYSGPYSWTIEYDTSTSFTVLPAFTGKSIKVAFKKPGVYWYEFTTKSNAYTLVQLKKSGSADTPPNDIMIYPQLFGNIDVLGYYFSEYQTAPNPINLYFYETKSSKRYLKFNAKGKEEFLLNITTFDPAKSFMAERNITKKFVWSDYYYWVEITPTVLFTDPAFSSLLLYDFLPKGFDLTGISRYASYNLHDRVFWSINMDNKNLVYLLYPSKNFYGKATLDGKLEVTIPILGGSAKKTLQIPITGKKYIVIDKPANVDTSIEDWKEY